MGGVEGGGGKEVEKERRRSERETERERERRGREGRFVLVESGERLRQAAGLQEGRSRSPPFEPSSRPIAERRRGSFHATAKQKSIAMLPRGIGAEKRGERGPRRAREVATTNRGGLPRSRQRRAGRLRPAFRSFSFPFLFFSLEQRRGPFRGANCGSNASRPPKTHETRRPLASRARGRGSGGRELAKSRLIF